MATDYNSKYSGTALSHNLNDLVGLYVEVV